MKSAVAASVIAFAHAIPPTPGIVEPSTHVCIEGQTFGTAMWENFGDKEFPRQEWNWDEISGHGPFPGAFFPDMRVRTAKMGTSVVDFKIGDTSLMKKSILKRTEVFKEIKNIMAQQSELYHNYNLNFDNSILFVPEWMEFMEANRKTVIEIVPDCVSVAANVFHVAPGQKPFGVHNAEHAATAIMRNSFTYWSRLLNETANRHVSFHTAIDDQLTIDDQPLIIYENLPAQVANIGYMVRDLKSSSTVDKDRINAALSAVASKKMSIMQPASNYITTQWLLNRYCPISNPDGDGYWWPLKAGQALHFDNFVFHGASSLGKARNDRFTMDMRVTSYYLNSCNSSMYYFQNPQVNSMFKRGKECISKIFGYDSYYHLLETMFNKKVADACANTPLFYFAINPHDMNQDFDGEHLFFTIDAMKKHKAFAKEYFENDEFVMPEAARECIASDVGPK